MKKIMIFFVCTALCMWLTSCVGPGTGPYGAYTAADRYRDTVHTTAAVGAVAVGASLFGNLFHHGYYHNRVYAPYVYYAPVVRPLPRGYIYR
ncbi:Lipoprotein [Candidatus Electrothrix laxa]